MLSPLIPQDMSLRININNIIYTLTPKGTENVATPHCFHLFVNPHNGIPYLRHTHEVDERTIHRFEIISTLSSARS